MQFLHSDLFTVDLGIINVILKKGMYNEWQIILARETASAAILTKVDLALSHNK